MDIKIGDNVFVKSDKRSTQMTVAKIAGDTAQCWWMDKAGNQQIKEWPLVVLTTEDQYRAAFSSVGISLI